MRPPPQLATGVSGAWMGAQPRPQPYRSGGTWLSTLSGRRMVTPLGSWCTRVRGTGELESLGGSGTV